MAKGKVVPGVYVVNGTKMTLTRKEVLRRERRKGKDRQHIEHYRTGTNPQSKGMLT